MSDIVIEYPLDPAKHRVLTSTFPTLVAKARAAGIYLTQAGDFTGNATGKMSITADRVHIHVTDKPWIVSERRIREGLTELLDELLQGPPHGVA
jgi:hypothetical protein